MHKKTVMLPADLRASLEEIAQERGMSLSAVIREALEQYLHPTPFPKSIGMISDESFDASKDEEYLAVPSGRDGRRS